MKQLIEIIEQILAVFIAWLFFAFYWIVNRIRRDDDSSQ